MTARDLLLLLVSLILLLYLTVMASRGIACLRYYCCSGPRSGAMKRGQGILPFELFHSMESKVYDALHLRVLWHLHEAQSCFCHRGDEGGEDWIRRIVEILVEIAWEKTGALSSSGPALALISCSAGCVSGFIFILRGVLGQIIL